MMKKRKKSLALIGLGLAFLCCFACVSYPLVSNYLYDKSNVSLITAYEEQMAAAEDRNTFQEELLACRVYNQALASPVSAAGKAERDLSMEYSIRLNMNGSGLMGYIAIPKIDLTLPVYHGTEAQVLASGLGHMEGTSLPVGGTSTHAVISGHSGMSGKRLLTDLETLELGDMFSMHVLNETLTYRVDQIKTVLPTELEDLKIIEGEDYLTLVTCTPYGINSHRLLVRGKRTGQEEAMENCPGQADGEAAAGKENGTWIQHYFQAIQTGFFVFFCVLAIFSGIEYIHRKRKENSDKTFP